MPVCVRCGEDNPERARFCLACAAPLAAPAVPRREERKRVSVLFCDLVGFTSRAERLDVEDVRAFLGPYYARLRAELERFGGTVEKFIGDAVMALFGAPVAHEDDPERAVRAALAIRETIAGLNDQDPGLDLHVRIGVTTGEALVALDARPVEGEGMASGDVVNTAARLQAAAPVDGVLVDETTWRATDRQVDYRPAEPVTAKGKAEPVPAWLAQAPRASLGVEVDQAGLVDLVGREQELQLLGDALDRARRSGTVQLVTLVGVPGMGKSRLVWELKELVEAEPELTVWRQGRCLPYGEGVALWALGEVVKAQAGILDTDPADAAEAKLALSAGDLVADEGEAAWVTGHLRPLVGLAGPAQDTGDRLEEAFAAWRRFLEGLAEQGPAVLVVEDLHWADELLLDFLDHLVDWAAEVPLLVVTTARPELLARRPGWGGGKPNSAIVSLAPLSETDTARLVASLLKQVLLPAELQAALLARAGGNPLYAEEYVRMLGDRGFLRRAGGSWRLERVGELPLPETVQGIIAARLDALGEEEKALLQDAAVLGKVGWVGALAALAGAEPAAVERRLHSLERRELLRRERRSQVAGERQYAFRHVLVRDVAYAQLPRAARAERHRRAAHWLQGLAPDRAEDRAELAAHHWQAALQFARAAGQDTDGLAGPARQAYREAGDRAFALNALGAAARWYRAALELWPAADPERPRLLMRLARAAYWAEEPDAEGLAEALEEARDGLLAGGDRATAAEAESLLSTIALLLRQGRRAEEHAWRAVALLEGTGPSPAAARVLNQRASLSIVRGRADEAIRVARQALAMAEPLGLDDERGQSLMTLGSGRFVRGDLGGLDDLEQAVAIHLAIRSPRACDDYANLASLQIAAGKLARGFELQARAREVAERFGLTVNLRELRYERVSEDYWSGRWEAAVTALERLFAELATGAYGLAEPQGRIIRGWVRLAAGDPPGALDDLDTGLVAGRAAGDVQFEFPLAAVRALALLAAGDRERAGAQASELLSKLEGRKGCYSNPDWSGSLAVVLEALGRGRELLDLLATVGGPTPWFEAAAAVAAGDFEAAADRYATIGSRPDEAFARLLAAERLVVAGRRAEAEEQARNVLAFAGEAGAAGWLRRAEALLAASA